MNIVKTTLAIGALGCLSLAAANAAGSRGQHVSSTHKASSSRSSRVTKSTTHGNRTTSARAHKRNADTEARTNAKPRSLPVEVGPTNVNDEVELPRRESEDENDTDNGNLMPESQDDSGPPDRR